MNSSILLLYKAAAAMRPVQESTFSFVASNSKTVSSLYSKFGELEKKWAIYNKFDDLERKWTQLNPLSKASSNKNETPETINVEADLYKKWDQLSALSKDDLTQDSDGENSSQHSTGNGELDAAGNSEENAPSSTPLEPKPEVESEPEPETPGFTLKKRSKRPRRLLTLRKIRPWSFGNHKENPERHAAEDTEDEEVLFETACTPKPVGSQDEFHTPESRDEQNFDARGEDRFLLSMSNQELWQARVPGECEDNSASENVHVPTSSLLRPRKYSEEFPTALEKLPPVLNQETIVFATAGMQRCSPKPFHPEMWGIGSVESGQKGDAIFGVGSIQYQESELEPEQREDQEQGSMLGEIEVLTDGREQIQRCETLNGDIELWVKEQISMHSSKSTTEDIGSWVREQISQRSSSSKSVHSQESDDVSNVRTGIVQPKEQMYALKKSCSKSSVGGSQDPPDRNSIHSREHFFQVNEHVNIKKACSNKTTVSFETGVTSKGPENHLQSVVRELLHQRLRTVSAVMIQSWIRMKLVQRAYRRSLTVQSTHYEALSHQKEDEEVFSHQEQDEEVFSHQEEDEEVSIAPHTPYSASPESVQTEADAEYESTEPPTNDNVVAEFPSLRYITSCNGLSRRRDLLSPTVAHIQFLRKAQLAKRYSQFAAVVQSAYRRWKCRGKYSKIQKAIRKVQCVCRKFLETCRREAAAIKIQRFWLSRIKDASQWSIDGTDVSTLSFDNSYLSEEGLSVAPHCQRPYSFVWAPGELFPSSPLSKHRHPPAPSMNRSRLSQRYASPLPPRPPAPPRLSPRLRLQSVSQRRRHANAAPEQEPALSCYQRRASPFGGRQQTPPRPRDLDTGLQAKRVCPYSPTQTRKRGKSVLPSPKPKTNRLSPLAYVVSGTPAATSETFPALQLPIEQSSVISNLDRSKSSCGKAKGKSNQKRLAFSASGKVKSYQPESVVRQHQRSTDIAPGQCAFLAKTNNLSFVGRDTDSIHNACTKVQRVWRGYRAQLTLISMLLTESSVLCDCNRGWIQRNRVLRQRAQLMSLTRAVGQVGPAGAKSRLSFRPAHVISRWQKTIYVNVEVPGSQVIKTVSTVCIENTALRIQRLNSMSREKITNLMAKAALEQHLQEQKFRVSRTSLLERSLSRRRAPVEREAATRIQKNIRRFLEQRHFVLRKGCIIVLQRNFRRCRRQLLYSRQRRAAFKIQSFFRGELVRGIVFQFWVAATSLRGFWNPYRQVYLKNADKNASKIQAAFRGIKVRDFFHVQNCAAIAIQNYFRAKAARHIYLRLKWTCIQIQTTVRQRIAMRLLREDQSATLIQQWWRFEQCSNMMKGLCASTIATAFRRYRDCRNYRRAREAALVLQRCRRGFIARRMLVIRHRYATIIQSFVRRAIQRRAFVRSVGACTLISSWYRGTVEKREYKRLKMNLICLQKNFRMCFTR